MRGDRPALGIDDRLAISTEADISTDAWISDVQFTTPSYAVTRLGGDPKRESDVFGVIANETEIEWLRKAIMYRPNGVRTTKALFRLHELGAEQFGVPAVHMIEALTGEDAKAVLQRQFAVKFIGFVRLYWWQLGLACALTYWWCH